MRATSLKGYCVQCSKPDHLVPLNGTGFDDSGFFCSMACAARWAVRAMQDIEREFVEKPQLPPSRPRRNKHG